MVHMLNLFPIQFLAPVSYFLLRVVLGFVLLRLGIRHLQNREILAPHFSFRFFPFGTFFAWYLSIIEVVLGGLLIAGFLTQIAALLTIFLALKFLIMYKHFAHPLIPERTVYFFMLGVATSLCITGAGIFAFDLPI